MKGLGRKASFLAVVAVLATAVMGSAYSLWFEKLTATTNITTTHLDAQITCTTPSENEAANWPLVGPYFQAYPTANPIKQVASAVAVVQTAPFHLMEIQVDNAYPGYAWDCQAHIYNTAPLPWHLEDMVIKVLECDSNGQNCVPVPPPPPPKSWAMQCDTYTCWWGDLGISPPTFPNGLDSWSPFYVAVPNWEGCQVHNTNTGGVGNGGSLQFGVNQSAKQNTRYKIVIEYQVNQWNESAWGGCGNMKPGFTGPVLSQLQ